MNNSNSVNSNVIKNKLHIIFNMWRGKKRLKHVKKPKKKYSNKSPINLTPGEHFGKRYQIIKKISQSSVGIIYKALNKESNHVVALRLINPELNENEWIDIAKRIRDKKEKFNWAGNNVNAKFRKLYDIGEIENTKYISMEYAEWESLKPPKKLIISLSTALIILIGLVIFFAVVKSKPEPPPLMGPGKKSIAIMYFENNTGNESFDHWRKAFSDLLITDLSQSRYIRVLSEEKLFNILQQLNHNEAQEYPLEVLQQVAEKGQVEFFLLGSYSKAGNQFRINIKIQEAKTGELIGSEMVKGEGEESIFPMVDDLTKRIKSTFEFTGEIIANDIDKEVGKITTSSPEAYKYYTQGFECDALGDYRQCIQFMEKAVAIDPEFAMAYRSIANAYGNLGYLAEQNKYLQKAMKLTDRVSDRELYLIQGSFYLQKEKTLDKAIEAYEKLLQLYPDDLVANNNLGVLYTDLEKWNKAIERFEVLKLIDESIYPYANLSYLYMQKGWYNKTREILEYYQNNYPDNTWIHRYLAYNYLCQNEYDLALTEADKAISLDPDNFESIKQKGEIYHLKGDLIKAKNEYNKLLESDESIAHLRGRYYLALLYSLQGKRKKAKNQLTQGLDLSKKLNQKAWIISFHITLADLYLILGKPEEALQECNNGYRIATEAEEAFYQKIALYSKAFCYLESESIDNAAKIAEELKLLIEEGEYIKQHLRYYYHLIGMIEIERNNYVQAIKYLKKSLSTLPHQSNIHTQHALFIEPLASAYYQAGELEKAREEYEKITSLTTGRLAYGDIYARSYYMLGKIYQQKGWEGKAIENYQIFLNLWKDADSNIPELKDAENQLAILQTSSFTHQIASLFINKN